MDDGANQRCKRYRSNLAQVLATLALNTLMVNVGMMLMMSTYVIGALRLGDPHLSFTEEQASWFGGMIFMIQPLGSLVSGFIQDHLGRRNSMMIINIPQVLAWLLIYYSTSVTMLFAAVIILGLTVGFMEAPVLSYIGEVSEPRLRGVLSTLGGVFFNIGLVTESFIGAAAGWRVMALVTSTAPVISIICLALVPESPAWLVSKGRVEEARRSYQWLRGWVPPHTVREELDTLVDYVNSSRRPRVVAGDTYLNVPTSDGDPRPDEPLPSDTLSCKLRLLLSPAVLGPFRLIVFFFIISTCASLAAMRPFIMEVLKDLHLPVSSDMFVVFSTLLTLLGSLTTTLTVRRVGKRVITFLSLSVCTVCCVGLGVYLCLGLRLPWLPLVLFSVCSYASTAGIIFVPWVLISELFPLRARGIASGVAAAAGYFLMFTNIKTYYSVVSLVNVSGACFLYGSVGAVGLVYLYIAMPETEGVTLQSIERLYSGDENKNLANNTEKCGSE